MFYIFLLIFLLIIFIFFVVSMTLIYHALKYRLPEKDTHIKPAIIIYVAVSAILTIVSFVAFFNIPWDVINF